MLGYIGWFVMLLWVIALIVIATIKIEIDRIIIGRISRLKPKKNTTKDINWSEESLFFDKIVISIAIFEFCLCLSICVGLSNNPTLKNKKIFEFKEGIQEVMKKKYE